MSDDRNSCPVEAVGSAELISSPLTPVTIPPHIAANIMVFLRRAKCEGEEALAWVEAYTFMEMYVPKQQAGIPFPGLPGKAK
jgi:hypothetical protein